MCDVHWQGCLHPHPCSCTCSLPSLCSFLLLYPCPFSASHAQVQASMPMQSVQFEPEQWDALGKRLARLESMVGGGVQQNIGACSL